MKKKIVMNGLILMGFIVIWGAILYPRDLITIIGEEPTIDSDAHLTVIHRNSILESGNVVEANSQKHAKELVDFLKAYKYRRTSIAYRKLDDMESYSVIIMSNENEILRVAIRGDKHISITDKNGNYSRYRVSRNEFDIEFLQDFYESLRIQ